MSRIAALLLLVCVLGWFGGVGGASHNSHLWSALTLQVEPKSEECFYEDLSAGETLEMDFEVVRGGLLDVRVAIYGPPPGESTLFEKMAFFNHEEDSRNEQEGHVNFVAVTRGTHSICFDNRMSRWTAKVISFAVKRKTPAGQDDGKGNAKLEHLGPVVDSVIKISDELDAIERLQHHMRVREQVHRDTQESTNSRVQWLAIIEAIVLVSLSVLQLQYIRQWFSDDSKRRRV